MIVTFVNKLLTQINASTIAKRLISASFWSLMGGIIARGLALVSFVIVARILGKETLGELAIIQSTAIMISTFAVFGLSLTASKHVAEYRISDPDRAARVLKLSEIVSLVSGGIFFLLMFFSSFWLAKNVLSAPHLSDLLKISAVMLFFLALDGAQTGALVGFEAFKVTAGLNLAKGIITFLTMLIGVHLDGLRGVTIALAISSAFGWFINRAALKIEVRKNCIPLVTFKECRKELRLLWSFSLPSAICGILLAPTMWVCSAMLANEPGGYEQLGLYDIANRFFQIIIFFGVTIGAPLLPLMSDLVTSSNKKVRKINVLLTWGLGLFAAFPLIIFPEIIQKMFGNQFSGHDFLLTCSIMLFTSCVVLYKQGLARALAVKNLLWWGVVDNVIWALLMLTSTYALVIYGAIGLALALLISYVLNTFIIMPLYMKRNIVPRGTLISIESGIVWVIAFFPIYMVWAAYSIEFRVMYLIFGGAILIISFFSLYKQDKI